MAKRSRKRRGHKPRSSKKNAPGAAASPPLVPAASPFVDSDAGEGSSSIGQRSSKHSGSRSAAAWGLPLMLVILLALGVWVGHLLRGAPAPDEPDASVDSGAVVAVPAVPPTPGGTVSGRVTSQGEGVAAAELRLIQLGKLGVGQPRTRRVNSSSRGIFEFVGLAPATFRLEVGAEGYEGQVINRLVPPELDLQIELSTGTRMVGRLLDPSGSPVAGVVRVAGPGLWPPLDATAGGDGKFVTPPLAAGTYRVLARAPGVPSSFGAYADVTHDREPSDDRVEIPLSPAATLHLRVVGVDAEAVPALVTISDGPVYVLGLPVWASSGEVEIFGLPPGRTWISVRAQGYTPLSRPLELPAEGGRQDLTLTLERACVVRGRVVDSNGNPRSLVRVEADVATALGGRWQVDRDTTMSVSSMAVPGGFAPSFSAVFGFVSDDDGHFELTGLPAGSVVVEAQSAGYQRAWAGPLEMGPEASVSGIELVLRPGFQVSGRVVGTDGEPLDEARVSLRGPAPRRAPGTLRRAPGAVPVDSDGRFTLRDMPDSFVLVASAPGYAQLESALALADRDLSEPIELKLSPSGAEVRGRVRTRADSPVASASLRMLSPPGTEGPPQCLGRSDDAGRFRLIGCPDGVVWVEMQSDTVPAQIVRVTAGSENEVVVADSVKITIAVRADASPIADATVRLDPVAVEGAPTWLVSVPIEAVTDTNGEARFDVLDDRPQDVTVSAEGFTPASARWSPPPVSEPLRVELTRARELVGAVVDRYGSPVEGARVRVSGASVSSRQLVSGPRGQFTLSRGPGALQVEAVHPRLGRGKVAVGEGELDDLVVELNEPVIDLERWASPLAELGCEIWADGEAAVVEALEAESAASRAGLERGDLVVSIRSSTAGLAVEVLRGERGLTLTLTR